MRSVCVHCVSPLTWTDAPPALSTALEALADLRCRLEAELNQRTVQRAHVVEALVHTKAMLREAMLEVHTLRECGGSAGDTHTGAGDASRQLAAKVKRLEVRRRTHELYLRSS